MTNATTSEAITARPLSMGRLRPTATLTGAWAFVLTGVGHVAIATLAPQPDGTAAVVAQMRTVHFSGGVTRDLSQLMTGFSLAMAVLLLAVGAVALLLVRRRVLARRDPLLAVLGTLSLVLLCISMAFFPAPPIATMVVAVVAFTAAWTSAE